MPAQLSKADRRLLLGAGVAGILVFVGMAVVGSPEAQESTVPSVFSASAGGARAAYLLLQDLHYPVRLWEDPPSELPREPEGTMLILAEPDEVPTDGERRSLRDYVTHGGRVLFCGAAVSTFFHDAHIERIADADPKEFRAEGPWALARKARTIVIRPQARWIQPQGEQLGLYDSVVVGWQIGQGRLLWWAGATPLTNEGITRAGNLNFFLNALSDGGAGKPLSLYWDEYFHGQRTSLLSYARRTPLPWGVLQLAMVAALVLFTFSRRSGPIVMPAAESRLSPLEFVDTMGGLYQRSRASTIPVEVYYRNLRAELSRRLSMPAATPDSDLARAAGQRLGIPATVLDDALQGAAANIAGAGEGKLSARDALALVRKLCTCAARLSAPERL